MRKEILEKTRLCSIAAKESEIILIDNMAGSQLKQLKAALKENGLTGQQNVKNKKTTKRAPSEMRRDDKQEIINKIRDQFNPFEIKVNKQKSERDYQSMKGAQGRPGISKQIGEEQRRLAYEAKKAKQGKNGIINDRRFGERDATLTAEERMLERFTRERQMQSSKLGMYNLDSDDEDSFGGDGLTHYGKSLAIDDFEQDDDLLNGSDDEFMRPKKRSYEETQAFDIEPARTEDGIPKKKTKAEVMKEVIAKSKFYKQQRQQQKEENNEKIMDLDDEFQDVLQELGSMPRQNVTPSASSATTGINYEQSVRELNMEKRAAPADRTKTEDEVKRERMAKMRELEEARLRRMRGETADDGEKVADDLDDDFWVQGSDEEGFAIQQSENEQEDEEDGSEESEQEFGRPKAVKSMSVVCPEDHDQFIESLEGVPLEETASHIRKILSAYAPALQMGNKQKLATFTTILFQHILYLSEVSNEEPEFARVQEELITILRSLSEKYNQALAQHLRYKIQEIHERIQDTLVQKENSFPLVSDLTFFGVVGLVYSTSDHYHLIATPVQIIMGEVLEQLKFDTLQDLISGAFIAELFLKYQRISKRFVPEILYFLQKALLILSPAAIHNEELVKTDIELRLPSKLVENPATLKISDIDRDDFDEDSVKTATFFKILSIVDLTIETWKDKSAFIEIITPFQQILIEYESKFPKCDQVTSLLLKIKRLLRFSQDDRKPLTLQSHKKLAIATYAPKFEENFNPDKKSYDEDRSRQEINKMRKQIKQERKITMRELRKDTRFESRQQIAEKKKQYSDYHAKMAKIMNTINTVEGAEKNEYAREKKLRKGKK